MKTRVFGFFLIMVSGLILTFHASSQAAMAPDKESAISSAILKQRDPFKEPKIEIKQEGPRSELETTPIERLKLLGVMTGGPHLRAMLGTPGGKTYFVQEHTRIGVRKGVIKSITDKGILVREKIVNVLGNEETVETMIELPPDTKKDVKQITSEQGW